MTTSEDGGVRMTFRRRPQNQACGFDDHGYVQIAVRLDPAMYRWLADRARAQGVSFATAMRLTLSAAMPRTSAPSDAEARR